MIYIFEDRLTRKEEHDALVNEFPDLLSFAKFDIDSDQNPEDYIIEKFDDAECVLFHKSYTFRNQSVDISKIQKSFLEDLGIKFCLFSGGTDSSNYHDGFLSINADVMYNNMRDFLEDIHRNKRILIDVLQWGKQYKLNRALSVQSQIHSKYFTSVDLNTPFNKNDFEDIDEDLMSIGIDINSSYERYLSHNDSPTWMDIMNLIQEEIDNQIG